MRRFANILFSPFGDSDDPQALRRVAELAFRNGARLTLFGVVPEPSRRFRLVHRAEFEARAESAHRHDMRRRLEALCDSIDGVDVELDVRAGNVATRIVGEVLAQQCDLVIVTSDDDRKDRVAIRRLVRKCPCPVWVIRPGCEPPFRVAVAVNPEPDETVLNNMLLELAAGLVELFGGELHLVHAWELYGEAAMVDPEFPSVSAQRADELLGAERTARSRALDELVAGSRVADRPWQLHLIKGAPDSVVPATVRSLDVDVLVMGTVARQGLTGFIIGNTAELVFDSVDCSVIAVKPPGFEPPDLPIARG